MGTTLLRELFQLVLTFRLRMTGYPVIHNVRMTGYPVIYVYLNLT